MSPELACCQCTQQPYDQRLDIDAVWSSSDATRLQHKPWHPQNFCYSGCSSHYCRAQCLTPLLSIQADSSNFGQHTTCTACKTTKGSGLLRPCCFRSMLLLPDNECTSLPLPGSLPCQGTKRHCPCGRQSCGKCKTLCNPALYLARGVGHIVLVEDGNGVALGGHVGALSHQLGASLH